VLHEMEHLRRGDDWTNLLQKLSLVVFPLNPALIWIERQLCLERELACDDRCCRRPGLGRLMRLAWRIWRSTRWFGAGFRWRWARGSGSRRWCGRVHRILAGSRNEMGPRRVAGVVAVLMVGVIGAADGLAHAPALVSFGPARVDVAAVERPGVRTPVDIDTEFVGMNPHANPTMPARPTDVVYHPATQVKARPSGGGEEGEQSQRRSSALGGCCSDGGDGDGSSRRLSMGSAAASSSRRMATS
jgi:hypothetical protein